jgi:hypothetical protein
MCLYCILRNNSYIGIELTGTYGSRMRNEKNPVLYLLDGAALLPECQREGDLCMCTLISMNNNRLQRLRREVGILLLILSFQEAEFGVRALLC